MGKLSPSEVRFWLNEAKACEERQKKELIQRNSYPFLVCYYEGFDKVDSIYPHVSAKQSLSIINEFFPNTNAIISDIMYQNPDIIAEASKPEAEEGQIVMQSALSYAFDKTNALIENRLAIFDMLAAGYCCVEVDHVSQEQAQNELKLLPSEEEMAQRELTVADRVKNTVKKFGKSKNVKEAEEQFAKVSPDDKISHATTDGTYLIRRNPLDCPLDWRAKRLRDRRYSLKKVWLSPAEASAKYPKFKDRLQHTEDNDNFLFGGHHNQDHSKKILFYEFQIRVGRQYKTIIITPTITNTEIDMFTRPYQTNGFNQKVGTLHKYGALYPISMFQINKKMSDELNHYVRFIMEVAEKNIPKRVYDKNKVKADGIEAMNNSVVNNAIPVEGAINAIAQLPHTNVSTENKELMNLFDEVKQKLWARSNSRLGQASNTKLATDLKIQEAGFESQQLDLQEGLRILITEELDTLKDIVVSFWDGEHFFRVTGGDKPTWYESITVNDPYNEGQQMVLNPLADILTGDYFIKVDISSALRPNKERRKAETLQFFQVLVEPNMLQYLQMAGLMPNPEEIKKISKDFGFTPEALFTEAPPPVMPEGVPEGMPQGGMPV